jgi:hypothetical protein
MMSHFPYFAAAVVTTAVGAVASAVFAAPAPPAPPALPALHPPVMPGHPIAVLPPAHAPPAIAPAPAGNNANTPAATPVQPGMAQITPGFSAAQQVGTGGVPGTPSFTEGFGTTSPFGSTSMNQPGQSPFTEGLSGNQGVGSSMNQPGQPDFYDGFGFNRGVVPPNQGAQPSTPYPNYTTSPRPASTVVVSNAPGAQVTAPAVGFYNGFGGGQPDFGFYAGFTTPR